VDYLGIFDDMVGALDFDEKAGHRVITNLAHNLLSVSSLPLRFTCKTRSFRSGAEGIRTPDLRRAKSEHYYRGCSSLFKNTTPKVGVPLLEHPVVHLEDGASLP
jgi:hypothetical protein